MRPDRTGGDRLTEHQKAELARVVTALARVESVSKALRGYARNTRDIHEDDIASIDAARDALYDIDVLGETILYLQLDAVEALTSAFPGLGWSFDEPGYMKASA